ncbi:E3 ubiquitin/ISG15 ligase TRIM25-like [Hyperolius riggenbachi]|uniref:E3 ubiquitin/ISG15 ligase TRIM25-like n=1 Tax=Hyperolius riggenbachi TaxID=752182 RepID=UPI0035A26FC0
MASAGLRAELECSICLSIYTDPVTLLCGHNFCRVCIAGVLNSQDSSRIYSCPQCRKRFPERPALQKNTTLSNMSEYFCHLQPHEPETRICCTYCIHSPVPAAKSCLLCEASLCEEHLKVHSKAPEHVLCDPTTNMEARKCSAHKKILGYYCSEDSACLCVSCILAKEHKGHQVETLDEAFQRKKWKLTDDLQKLITKTQENEKRVQSLEERRRKIQEKADEETQTVNALFRDLRKQMEDLEKRVLSDITRQAERASREYSEVIRQLNIRKDELTRKMRHIEELCSMTDPLTVLWEANPGDLCDTEEDRGGYDGGDLDVASISRTLHTGLSAIITGVSRGHCAPGPTHLSLDENTASNYLNISPDRKSASWSDIEHDYPETANRFLYEPQVLSSQRFSSGQHYWEVRFRRCSKWRLGVCYPTIDRGGLWGQSVIGDNEKSWCLKTSGRQYSVGHDSNEVQLSSMISSNGVRVHLNYEAGTLAFYELGILVKHLHTFTATFTEPLHAALCVWEGCVEIAGESVPL